MTPRQEAELRNLSNVGILGGPSNSPCIDGQWTKPASMWLSPAFTMSPDEWKQLDVSSFLPSDDYDYEVVLTGYSFTTYTVNDQVNLRAVGGYYSGTEITSAYYQFLDVTYNQRVDGATRQVVGFTTSLVVPANSQYISIYNAASTSTGSTRLGISRFKRLGTNK